MRYYIKLLGLLYLILSMGCFIIAFFAEDRETPIIYGILLLLLFQIHMLEQTILNNVIRPKKIVINLNGETFITQEEKENSEDLK